MSSVAGRPFCPLTGSTALELVTTIGCADLARIWAQDLDIDTSALFQGTDQLSLWHNADAGFSFFDPPIVGDAGFYTALRKKPWYVQRDKWEFREAAQIIAPGARVFDLGAGAGQFAARMPHASYVAADRFAETECEADVLERGYCGHDYDVLCAFQVLEHVAEPIAFLRNHIAALRPGGELFIGVPNQDSYLSTLRGFPLDLPPHHVTRWSPKALCELAAVLDLQIIAVSTAPLEAWERDLYWLAKVEDIFRGDTLPQAVARTTAGRWGRVSAFMMGTALRRIGLKGSGPGSTLLLRARKPDVQEDYSPTGISGVSRANDPRQPFKSTAS